MPRAFGVPAQSGAPPSFLSTATRGCSRLSGADLAERSVECHIRYDASFFQPAPEKSAHFTDLDLLEARLLLQHWLMIDTNVVQRSNSTVDLGLDDLVATRRALSRHSDRPPEPPSHGP